MTDRKPADVPGAGLRKTSNAIMLAVLMDLLVIVPYSYWRLHGHRLDLIIAWAVEGIGILSLLGMALYFRRRGTLLRTRREQVRLAAAELIEAGVSDREGGLAVPGAADVGEPLATGAGGWRAEPASLSATSASLRAPGQEGSDRCAWLGKPGSRRCVDHRIIRRRRDVAVGYLPGGPSHRVRGRDRTPVPLAGSGRRPRSARPTQEQPPVWARRRW